MQLMDIGRMLYHLAFIRLDGLRFLDCFGAPVRGCCVAKHRGARVARSLRWLGAIASLAGCPLETSR